MSIQQITHIPTQDVCQNVETIVHVTYHLVHVTVILDILEKIALKVCTLLWVFEEYGMYIHHFLFNYILLH